MRSGSDSERGLYRKFNVQRADGSSAPGGKHEHCDYFVLDVTHDEFAVPALAEYARECREKFPLLADDLEARLRSMGHPVPPGEGK